MPWIMDDGMSAPEPALLDSLPNRSCERVRRRTVDGERFNHRAIFVGPVVTETLRRVLQE